MVAKNKRKHETPIKIEARRTIIMQDLAAGYTYAELCNKYPAEWNMSARSVQLFICETLEWMRSQATKDTLIAMNTHRLDTIISESMREKDRKNAVRAIDVQNKLIGGYEEKVKVEADTDITLHFDI